MVTTRIAQAVHAHKEGRGMKWNGNVRGGRSVMRTVSPWVRFYFGMTPLYPEASFRSMLSGLRPIFERLYEDLMKHAPDIQKARCDAVLKKGIQIEVKVIALL